jgi:uncharacterized protein YqeY
MRDRLRGDLTAAMKARDEITVAALRSAIAAIDNAEAVPVSSGRAPNTGSRFVAGAAEGVRSAEAPRLVLGEDEVEAIIRAQADERLAAGDQYDALGEGERAERLRSEAAVLARYLATPDQAPEGGDQSARRPKNAR